LEKYIEDPDKFMVKFQTLALGFDITCMLFSSSWPTVALLQKRKKFLTAAKREAEEAFARDPIG
jgi:hypothetical protein